MITMASVNHCHAHCFCRPASTLIQLLILISILALTAVTIRSHTLKTQVIHSVLQHRDHHAQESSWEPESHRTGSQHLLRSGNIRARRTSGLQYERRFPEEVSLANSVLDPMEINVNTIYTPWTRWSRCKKTCKQIRKRYCTVPAICGSNTLKEERPCQRGRCQTNQKKRQQRRFHVIKRKKLSQRTRGMLKFNRAFYSRWSKWTPCSDTCKTSRSKSCKFSLVCGSSVINEEGYCYTEGSKCEEWYKQGNDLPIMSDKAEGGKEPDQEDVSFSGQTGSKDEDGHDATNDAQHSNDDDDAEVDDYELHSQCGVQNLSTDQSTPPWALRIIGGREAMRGRWSWQVAILNKYREVFCGGTLVAPGWVLTAAHCVRKHLYVRLGEHDLVVNEGSEMEYTVMSAVQHPEYNADTVDNDIALLRIPTSERDDVRSGRKIRERNRKLRRSKNKSGFAVGQFSTACLPDQDEELPESGDVHCTIVGWGKEKNSHVYGTDVLHEAEVPIVSREECLNVYRDYYISDNMFCAGYKGGRIDSCAGDSGGPLMCKNKNGFWTIYGITSFGEGCGQRYGIYAKVPNYSQWIRSVISGSSVR